MDFIRNGLQLDYESADFNQWCLWRRHLLDLLRSYYSTDEKGTVFIEAATNPPAWPDEYPQLHLQNVLELPIELRILSSGLASMSTVQK